MQDATVSPTQVMLWQQRLRIESQIKNAASWFFFIAGLSVVNSVIYLIGADWNFLIGLGITQLVDGFATAMAEAISPESASIFKVVALVLDLCIAGIFVLFGVLSRKKLRWAFIVGMGLYLLDGLIFVVLAIWLSVAFHALALWGLWGGVSAIGQLNRFDQAAQMQPAPGILR